MTVIIISYICRDFVTLEGKNQFTPKGVEQIKEAVSKRNSVGDMTKLELLISKR